MSLPYSKENVSFARNLRKEATKEEKHLWYDYLSGYPVRFQRQKPIGRFVADFYCHQAKLVIEIDGGQHYTEAGREKDRQRTGILEGEALKILRFSNREVNQEFQNVCEMIDKVVKEELEKRKNEPKGSLRR